ncbi:hypothetical protein [Pseudomonas sp. CGJS7]|uniref:hypothetical protein n=1 Tax=Pseudomonas sp. CGJS7 TaxID=3109348 RepID=UPI003009C90C
MTVSTAACQQPVPLPEIKLNPNPKHKYEVVMTIRDVPRPFEKIAGNLQFDVPRDKDACIPLDQTRALGGVRNRPTKDIPLELRKVSDTEYRGVFFTDMILEEDYYGLGVCPWELTAVGVKLFAKPAVFSTGTWQEAILSGDEQVTFAQKSLFDLSPEPIDFHPMTLAGEHFPTASDFQVNFQSRKIEK